MSEPIHHGADPRPSPSVLDRLAIAGLKPELVNEFRDRHKKRTACHCAICTGQPPLPEPEPGQLGAFDKVDR